MSTTRKILTSLEKQLPDGVAFENDDIMNDERYKRKLSMLITESLKKGSDVMQMESGDIIVTELKPVTFQFHWDSKKGRFERTKSSNRVKRVKGEETSSDDFDNSYVEPREKILEEA